MIKPNLRASGSRQPIRPRHFVARLCCRTIARIALVAVWGIALLLTNAANAQDVAPPLRWCAYITNGSVQKLASDPAALEKAPQLLRALGVSKVYLEFFRQTPVSNDDLKKVSDALGQQDFEVPGGIATEGHREGFSGLSTRRKHV